MTIEQPHRHESQTTAFIDPYKAALRTAMLANDVDALADLLHDDLVFTGPDGQVLSKEDDLSVHRSKLLRLDRLDLYETRVHHLGDLIVVTTKASLRGRYGSTPFEGTFVYTRLWRQSGAHWRIVAGHAAKIG
jgi:ketosteroid isomerase-like protein